MPDVELLHDLRVPLQLIQSSAQMIGAALEDPSLDMRAYLDMLQASAHQLRRMLDDAMAAHRREAPQPRAVDVVACLRGLCLRCRARADAGGITLTCAGNTGALVIETDEDALSRAVLNLISNALEATRRGGRVDVTWTALGDFVEIAVADDGRGIAAERLPYIFLRGETDGGQGYGLPSARNCARALGGELTAASQPGVGSVFTLRLPVRSAMAS